MLVTFGSSIAILMTFMLCVPTPALGPASSARAPDTWVAGSYDKNKDKDKDKDDDSWSDDDAFGTDHVDDAWADRVLHDPDEDRGWCQQCQGKTDMSGEPRVSYCEVREFPMARAGRLIALDGGVNGGMTVMGSDRGAPRLIYRVKARARTEERAKEIAAAVKVINHGGWIESEGPSSSGTGEWWSVEMKVWVPRTTDLSLKVLNGALGIRGVSGTMDVEAENGPVSLVDLGGAVVARVHNGPLHVQLTGASWQGKGLDAEAQNGPVNLVVPARYSARLQTGSIHGPGSMDYGFDTGRKRGWVTTTLGSGGAPVRVVTENGPYQVNWH
jgi:hypothetical protein